MRYGARVPDRPAEGRVERRRLLITGKPGAGKRALAVVLVSAYGFVHENGLEWTGPRSLPDMLLDADSRLDDVVVTWPDALDIGAQALVEHLGFEWVELCDRERPTGRAAGRAAARRMVLTYDPAGIPRPVGAILREIAAAPSPGAHEPGR
jgi:hypothetical protein